MLISSRALALIFSILLGCQMAYAEEPGRASEPDPANSKEQAKELMAAMKSKDPVIRAEAAEKALGNQAPSLTSPLVRLLADQDLGVRHQAMAALANRKAPAARKKAARALVPRLPRLSRHPADQDELMRAIDALRLLQQATSIKPLLDPIDVEMDTEEMQARINAVAGIPEAEAIERLIQFLAKGRRGGRGPQRVAAEKALRWATGQRLGRDPDKWRAWWRENKKDFSFMAVAEDRAAAEKKKREKAEKQKRRKKKGKRGKKKNKADEDISHAPTLQKPGAA